MADRDVTTLLTDWRRGDRSALDELMPKVYEELRSLAAGYLRWERPDHTLRSTALVHEAYMRLVGSNVDWENRKHFFGVAARAMRQIMVDAARVKLAEKRGPRLGLGSIEENAEPSDDWDLAEKTLELSEALDRLEASRPQLAQVVFLRYYAGLNNQEIASLLNLDERTVRRYWIKARGWLYKQFK